MTEPYFSDADLTLYQGDALSVLRDLPDRSVHMACTSPPFWNLRDYQADGQIGLEPTIEGWATSLVRVFAEVRRVLRDDAVLFIEIGDSYDGNKELVDQPGVLKNALRADGWRHRQTLILHKSNAMPESVSDRCTTAHSYVLLMVKSRSYYWDAEALREPAEWARWGDQTVPKHDGTETASGWIQPKSKSQLHHEKHRHKPNATLRNPDRNDGGGMTQGGFGNPHGARNARSVWTIPTEPNALAICRVCDAYWQGGAPREHCGKPVVQHFAAFPRELVRRMILAGTSERGVCAECGAPWVRETEVRQALAADGKTCLRCGKNHGATRAGSEHRAAVMVERFVCNETTTLGWQPSCECGEYVCFTCNDVLDGNSRTKDLSRVRAGVRPEAHADRVLLGSVSQPLRGEDTREAVAISAGVLGVQGAVHANEAQGEVLLSPLSKPLGGTDSSDDQGVHRLTAGLHPDSEARSSDGEQRGIRDGAPSSDGGALGATAHERRGGASQERDPERQPDREPRPDGEASPRPLAEAQTQTTSDHLPPLRGDDHGVGSCAVCGQQLERIAPSPIPATLLDPFSGSGTSLLVARQLGRHAIGVELSVPYCAMTRARLSQLSLLAEGVSS